MYVVVQIVCANYPGFLKVDDKLHSKSRETWQSHIKANTLEKIYYAHLTLIYTLIDNAKLKRNEQKEYEPGQPMKCKTKQNKTKNKQANNNKKPNLNLSIKLLVSIQ